MKAKIIVQCKLKIGDEYWFAAGNTNGLFKKNLLTGELDFIGFFPEEKKTLFRAYTDMKLVDNKIVFAPCYAEKIAIYDIAKKQFSNVAMPNREIGANKYLKTVQHNDCIYFVPFLASSFIKYNVSKDKIRTLDAWMDLRNEYTDHEVGNLIIEEICVVDSYIYMFMSNKNKAIILDMETDQFQVRDLSILCDERICSVSGFQNNIYIVSDKNNIYRWNYVNDKVELITNFSNYINYQNYYTHNIFITNKYIYLINVFNRDINVFNYIDNVFETIDMSPYVCQKKDNCMSLYYYYDIQKSDGDEIQLFSFYDGKYLTIKENIVTDSVVGFFITENYLEKCFCDEIITESMFTCFGWSLLEGINNILVHSIDGCDEEYRRKNIGKIVYDNLTRMKTK